MIKKLFLGLIFISTACVLQNAPAAEHGLYVSPEAVTEIGASDDAAASFVRFVVTPHDNAEMPFNRIYWRINSDQYSHLLTEHPDKHRILLSQFHESNIASECAVDVTAWLAPELHAAALSYLNTIFIFNNSTEIAAEQFDAVQISANVDDESWQNYTVLLNQIRAAIDSYNATTDNSIKLTVAFTKQNAAQSFPDLKPFDIADSVVLHINNRFLYFIKKYYAPEMEYAASIGLPVILSFTAKEVSSDNHESFWGFTDTPSDYLTQVLYTGLRDAKDDSQDKISVFDYFSQFPAFSGIAIDEYGASSQHGYEKIDDSSDQDITVSQTIASVGDGGSELDFIVDGNANYDPYQPTFERYLRDSIYLFIDLSTNQYFYSLIFDHDSLIYTFVYDGFTRSNNHDAIMQPLEKGQFKVLVHSALIKDVFLQDSRYTNPSLTLDGLNLRLKILDPPACVDLSQDPASAMLNSEQGIALVRDQNMIFTFITGEVERSKRVLPLTFKVFNIPQNASETQKELVFSSDDPVDPAEQFYFTFDDEPFGKVSSIAPIYNVIDDLVIISSDTLSIQGWAFDDNDSLDIALLYSDADNDIECESTVSRFVDPITNTISQWGVTYPAGFTLSCGESDLRGYYTVSVKISDGSDINGHTITIGSYDIYWNRPPTLDVLVETNVLNPAADDVPDFISISAVAQDLDADVSLGAYLSSVEFVLLDASDNPVKTEVITNNTTLTTLDINLDWPNYYDTGTYTLRAIARDSFGLEAVFEQTGIELMRVIPIITEITPRLGTSYTDNIVSVKGVHLLFVDEVSFGSSDTTIISGDGIGSSIDVKLPQFLDQGYYESRYIDVHLKGTDSIIASKDEAYRMIPGTLKNTESFSPSSIDTIQDLEYNNKKDELYLLKNGVLEIYTETTHPLYPDKPSLNYEKINEFSIGMYSPADMAVSKDGRYLTIIYRDNDALEIYDLDNNGSLHDIVLLDDAIDAQPTSIAWLMPDKVLVGSEGAQAVLSLITLSSTPLIEQMSFAGFGSYVYESIDVIPSSNHSTAYILCKNQDSVFHPFDMYRYDAKTNTFSYVSIDFTDTTLDIAAKLDSLRCSTNYDGSQLLLHTDTYAELFTKDGINTGIYTSTFDHPRVDLALFDTERPTLFTFSDTEASFNLRSLKNLDTHITSCNFPGNTSFYHHAVIDWHSEKLFALTTAGLAVILIDDIFPELSIDSFVEDAGLIATKPSNFGGSIENIKIYVNDQEHIVGIDNDTLLLSGLPDNDTTGKIRAEVFGFSSAEKQVFIMQKLSELVDFPEKVYFAPSNMFFDDLRNDLYLFDRTLGFGKTILRFHIEFNANGDVSLTRKDVPQAIFLISNPIAMARVHDYIVILAGYTRKCEWFNVEKFDNGEDPEIGHYYFAGASGINGLVYPSGMKGYSPSNRPDLKYAYIWDATLFTDNNVFQLDLSDAHNPVMRHCTQLFAPNGTQDILIETDDNYHNDRAYILFRSGNTSEILRAFLPYAASNEIVPVGASVLIDNSLNNQSPYNLIANNEYFITSLITGEGLSFIRRNGMTYTSYEYMIPRFIAADDEQLVFTGKAKDSSWNMRIIDTNIWNDLPFADPFSVMYNYSTTTKKTNDVEIIGNKIFAIIGNDIYITDIVQK